MRFSTPREEAFFLAVGFFSVLLPLRKTNLAFVMLALGGPAVNLSGGPLVKEKGR